MAIAWCCTPVFATPTDTATAVSAATSAMTPAAGAAAIAAVQQGVTAASLPVSALVAWTRAATAAAATFACAPVAPAALAAAASTSASAVPRVPVPAPHFSVRVVNGSVESVLERVGLRQGAGKRMCEDDSISIEAGGRSQQQQQQQQQQQAFAAAVETVAPAPGSEPVPAPAPALEPGQLKRLPPPLPLPLPLPSASTPATDAPAADTSAAELSAAAAPAAVAVTGSDPARRGDACAPAVAGGATADASRPRNSSSNGSDSSSVISGAGVCAAITVPVGVWGPRACVSLLSPLAGLCAFKDVVRIWPVLAPVPARSCTSEPASEATSAPGLGPGPACASAASTDRAVDAVLGPAASDSAVAYAVFLRESAALPHAQAKAFLGSRGCGNASHAPVTYAARKADALGGEPIEGHALRGWPAKEAYFDEFRVQEGTCGTRAWARLGLSAWIWADAAALGLK
jgi:hypothetical protein